MGLEHFVSPTEYEDIVSIRNKLEEKLKQVREESYLSCESADVLALEMREARVKWMLILLRIITRMLEGITPPNR